jgi:predicted DNA-binding ArsR family transcriptional regulator
MESREPSNGRATIREVYALVQQVNDNLEGQIKEVKDIVQAQTVSNENRFTVLEEKQKRLDSTEKQSGRAHVAFMARKWQVIAIVVSCGSLVLSAALKFVS